MILTVQNGLPWWYFQKLGGQYDNQKLESLDPTGILAKKIDANRIIGCVVYPAAAVTSPGVIHHVEGDRFPIGELDGKESERVKRIARRASSRPAQIPCAAGHPLGNLAQGLGQSVVQSDLGADPRHAGRYLPVRRDPRSGGAMMKEAQDHRPEARRHLPRLHRQAHRRRRSVGAHKTSMLQDVEAGRSLETEALIGSILEMAKLTNTPAPAIESVYALVKLLNKVMLLEGGGVKVEKVKAA
jgi:ketopantoate reductase